MTSIDSLMYSFIVFSQSETIMDLKSVHIDMGCNTFSSSNVQVIIFAGFVHAVSYISVLILCELKYQQKTEMLWIF